MPNAAHYPRPSLSAPHFTAGLSTFFTGARRTAFKDSPWGIASALERSSRFETEPSANGRPNTCSRISPNPRLLTCCRRTGARPPRQAGDQNGAGSSCRGSHHRSPHGNSDSTGHASGAPSPGKANVECPHLVPAWLLRAFAILLGKRIPTSLACVGIMIDNILQLARRQP
jgi:hypothetical protein